MTLADLQDELTKRGVLGMHVSLVGGRFSVVAVTQSEDADACGATLDVAMYRLLAKLPLLASTKAQGHA